MTKSYLPLKSAVVAGIAILCAGVAQGQTASTFAYPAMGDGAPIALTQSNDVTSLDRFGSLSLQHYNRHDTWNIVFWVSIVVGVIGIVDGDAGLIVIGAAGAILSSTQMNSYRFVQGLKGFDLYHSGALSLGMDPTVGFSDAPGLGFKMPSMYLKATFKF